MPKQISGTVEIDRNGTQYRGNYLVFGPTITVTYAGHQKVTQIGGSAKNPEHLARVMLGELVGEHAARR